MKIGYISIGNSKDTNTWSGTTYYFAKNLEEFADVKRISLEENTLIKSLNKYYKLKQKIFKKKYLISRSRLLSYYYSWKIKRVISTNNWELDALVSVGTVPLSSLNLSTPIVNFTDATFHQMIDYYKEFSNLSKKTIKYGNKLEKKALDNCSILFYSSDWAMNSAIKDYGINSSKVYSIPFGLNIDYIPDEKSIHNDILNKSLSSKCHLLFVGKDFERKGGDYAYKTLQYLNEVLKVDAHLTIIGCSPNIKDNRVTIIPYINKNEPSEQKLYTEILARTKFFILPTRADCTPMVCVEANAYGIPVITTNTGGLPSIIEEGVNGFKVDLEQSEAKYAEKIYNYYVDTEKYIKLCQSSREYYEEKTNWHNTCNFIVDKIETLISN